jgi:hypothetical protein
MYYFLFCLFYSLYNHQKGWQSVLTFHLGFNKSLIISVCFCFGTVNINLLQKKPETNEITYFSFLVGITFLELVFEIILLYPKEKAQDKRITNLIDDTTHDQYLDEQNNY